MTKEEFQKKVKWTKIFCIIIGILFVVTLVMGITQKQYISSILALGFIILLYLFYSLTKKGKIAGPIIGIGLGALYILQLDSISMIIGIFIIIDSIEMLKYVKQKNNDINLDVSTEKHGTKTNLIIIILIIVMIVLVGLKIFTNIGLNNRRIST